MTISLIALGILVAVAFASIVLGLADLMPHDGDDTPPYIEEDQHGR